MSQSGAKTLLLRIPRAFPDIEAVNEKSVTDIGRVLPSIPTMVAHQHVKAVNTSGKECHAPRISRRYSYSAASAAGSFDCGHQGGHPAPTRPPRVSRIEALDQHRASGTLDSDSRLPVHCGERETRG